MSDAFSLKGEGSVPPRLGKMQMSLPNGRYAAACAPTVAEGWVLERLTPPSSLFGANGVRTGRDGRIYIAQASGSQISAVDVASGQIDTISPVGSDIVGPDDLAFGPDDAIYATELMDGRVGVRDRHGRTRVLRGDLPAVNGITFHQGRLFVDECRDGGRLLELDLNGGEPRILLENIPRPNALEMGPDGMLYFPVMGANEIWRINPDGGVPERVAGDLGTPDAVKFDSKGYIVSTQLASGEVLRIDPRTGERTVLAALNPGVDNLTFMGDRLFVSSIGGQITEILGGGETKALLAGGMIGPLDLTMADDGQVYIADGSCLFSLVPGVGLRAIAGIVSRGWPGYLRGVAAVGAGEFVVATAAGTVARYWPSENASEVLAEGLDQLYGVAIAPDKTVVTAEFGTGRVLSIRSRNVTVLASGLNHPLGVAMTPEGAYVSEAGAGRVVKLSGGRVETVLDGLKKPHGMVLHGGRLYVVDAGAKSVVEYDLESKVRRTLAADLPVGPPPGVIPKPMRGLMPFCGPMGPFAGIAAGPDGVLYLSADGEGSVLALHPSGHKQ